MLGFHICKVTGVSMSPHIPEHSYVLVGPWLKILPLKKGSILKVNNPKYGHIIKSLVQIDRNGLFWLKGWHRSSVSIEEIGPVGETQILGKVMMVFPPKE